MSITAMKQALEALALLDALWYQSANMNPRVVERKMYAARDALRTAIAFEESRVAEAEKQEPVAWMYEWDGRMHLTFTDQRFVEQAHPHFNKATPLYTAPQPIEQPKQEPVAFICQGNAYMADDVDEFCQAKHTPLYTAPALRKPLGEQEVLDLLPEVQAGWTATTYGIWVARAIERAHGISGSTNNPKPKLYRTVTYVCPVCAASLERQE
jgi:hypothetical protein